MFPGLCISDDVSLTLTGLESLSSSAPSAGGTQATSKSLRGIQTSPIRATGKGPNWPMQKSCLCSLVKSLLIRFAPWLVIRPRGIFALSRLSNEPSDNYCRSQSRHKYDAERDVQALVWPPPLFIIEMIGHLFPLLQSQRPIGAHQSSFRSIWP